MSFYYQQGKRAPFLTFQEKGLIDWLEYIHKEVNDALVHPEEKEKAKGNNYAFFASAFGEPNDYKQPSTAKRAESSKYPPLRSYIVVDYDALEDKEYADELPNRINELFKEYNYAVYPTISYPEKPRYRFILETDEMIAKSAYSEIVAYFIEKIGYPHGDEANFKINHLQDVPIYASKEARERAVFNITKKKYPLFEILDELDIENTNRNPKSAPVSAGNKISVDNTALDIDALRDALNDFLSDSKTKENLDIYENFWRFTETVANAVLTGTITMEFAEEIMTKVAFGDEKWEKNNVEFELPNQINKLENNKQQQGLAKPITAYLPVAKEYTKESKNLSQLLSKLLGETFVPDPSTPPPDVANIISKYFEFALLPTKGRTDVENIAVYNPLTGAWEHDKDEFISMITVIKPGVTSNQVQTILMQWGAVARRNEAFIDPYHQSGFLLFQNGALDVETLELYDFNDPIVKNNQFTKRNKLSINWNPDATTKYFKGDRPDGGDWSIDAFIDGYTYNGQEDLKEFFLFGLALGLFAGHNTSVHFDIQGKSRLGKSTLSLIYDRLFEGRIATTTYSQLNQPFPLTSFDPDTAVVWVKECNIGTPPLNDEFGTPFYDGMADNQVRLSVKHGGDIIIDNPPQMYIDGTQFIQASEIQTGPAGRTLAFKLPDVTEEERDAFYSNDITSKFKDEKVMEYLVKLMVDAFRKFVPKNRIGNFKMNLASKRDIELLPKQAREWRHEFVNADINIKTWFEEECLPFMREDEPLHMRIMHEMYRQSVALKSGDKSARYAQGLERFSKNVMQIFTEYEIELTEIGSADKRSPNARPRRKVARPTDTGIDFEEYQESYLIPEKLQSAKGMPDLFGKKTTGWFTVKNLP